jgi:hypothetical protein
MTTQLTIRNLPEPVSLYLRKKAKMSNKSLNQVVIDELSDRVPSLHEDLDRSLGWFIGSGLDKDTVDALVREDELQKEKIAKEDALSRH